jgi:hypothetical protein
MPPILGLFWVFLLRTTTTESAATRRVLVIPGIHTGAEATEATDAIIIASART